MGTANCCEMGGQHSYAPGNGHVPGFENSGLLHFRTNEGRSAVVIPSSLTPSVSWSHEYYFSEFRWASAIIFQNQLGMISFVFAHYGKPDDFNVGVEET